MGWSRAPARPTDVLNAACACGDGLDAQRGLEARVAVA